MIVLITDVVKMTLWVANFVAEPIIGYTSSYNHGFHLIVSAYYNQSPSSLTIRLPELHLPVGLHYTPKLFNILP